ncbi:MAG: response regulator [Myxococcales bacterium]|nr:response regulator [Myxococcales bacterium]MDD9965270.1 response regulator [Myxococcales bacterium]
MSCGQCRIVLVDDEPMVVAAISAFIALETDHELVAFNDPEAALDYLDDHQVDIVIADLVMSSMTGEAFFEEVGRRHPRLPRLLLTGCCDQQRVQAAGGMGLTGQIDKPWCNEELRRLIETSVEARRRAREQVAEPGAQPAGDAPS